METILYVNQTPYTITKLLGHGKGGYSYLAEKDGALYVLKQIHHEPCSYYTFGNKIESEIRDYRKLQKTGIPIPKMLDVDIDNERILKEYIDGPTIYTLVKEDRMKDAYLQQILQMSHKATAANLNIDYFPTNFIVRDDQIYYIDYECNPYTEEWNFENWGIHYWSKTKVFLDHIKNDPYA